MESYDQSVEECGGGRQAHQYSATGELAESSLRRSAYPALQGLSCEFRGGILTLRGRLPSYYLKQVALAVVAKVEGVQRIDDRTEVAPPGESFAWRGTQTLWPLVNVNSPEWEYSDA